MKKPLQKEKTFDNHSKDVAEYRFPTFLLNEAGPRGSVLGRFTAKKGQ